MLGRAMNAGSDSRLTAPRIDDIRDKPAYTLAEAARYVRLPVATLRSWVVGRDYPVFRGSRQFRPIIDPATREPLLLSFWNLVEAHTLRALRTEHGVQLRAVRQALDTAQRALGIERLLIRDDLLTAHGNVFLDEYGKLVNLTASGQLAIRSQLEHYLARIDRDEGRLPIRLYPFPSVGPGFDRDRGIAIDPRLAFGRPVIISRAIATAVVADRIDTGESPEALAEDYGLDVEDIQQAILFERAA